MSDTEKAWDRFADAHPYLCNTDRRSFDAGFEAGRLAALEAVRNGLDSLPGSRASGYYAPEADGGYREAVSDVENMLTALRSSSREGSAWSCDHGCTEPTGLCLVDHRPASSPEGSAE